MMIRISVKRLSQGAQGPDVAEIHRALLALGKTVPASERVGLTYGAGTASAVRALQEDLNLRGTGVVDEATVQAINAKLNSRPTEPRIVRGTVRDADRNPYSNGFVQIFGQGPGGETVLGNSPLNAADGSYAISYQLPAGSNGNADLRVAVLNDDRLVDTAPSGASLLTDAGTLEVVNFVLSGDNHLPSTEYEFQLDDLEPLLGARDLADLTEDPARRDVSVLAAQSGFSPDQITALVLAHKLAKGTRIPPPVFYGLLRQGLPADADALHAVDPNERVKALKAAADQGLVPKEVDGRKIEDYLSDLVRTSAEPVRGLLGGILNRSELTRFVGQYLKGSQDPEAFWEQVAADPEWTSRAADLKLTVQLGGLTNNHVPLVTALKARPDVRQPSDLARLTEEQWKSLIRTEGVGVPPDTPGATDDEKTATYVQQILTDVEAAFPTIFFAERLGATRVAAFLKAQPSYDLSHTYPEQFFKQNPAAAQSLRRQDREQLRTLQRLYRLTGNTKETLALTAKGIRSSQQIARMDRKIFADKYKGFLSPARADEVYSRAQRTHAVALALFAEHAAALNRTGLQALPKPDSQKQAKLAANSIPDWPTLFGTFDLCACRECASVHGPAAYLVDILQFLDERGARAPLFARRPDLGDIELSCENANTPLPLVDLMNEILENAVAPPPPFAPLTLAPALEADLAQTTATPTLAAAFNPPLQSGARVEALNAGRQWRIWDEPFAYNVAKEESELVVTARTRQTTGSAVERRATPQYRNSGAYAVLGQTVFPWTLPFDLPREEAKVFLAHLGLSRRDLIDALRPVPEPFDPNAPIIVRLAGERLGLNDPERKMLVGEPLTPPRPPEDFWGGGPVTQFESVQDLLDRSGLSYADLEALVGTWFLNPTGALNIGPEPNAPIDTCDPTRLHLNGLTAEVLTRLHRFVRLWRKLGWTIRETDRAVRALVPDPNTSNPELTNEVLVRLDHLRTLASQLRLPVAHALALWKSIDTTEPQSLYRQLFYNPAVFKPQDDVFRLRPDGQELARTDALLADQAAALQAVFRLDAQGFAVLLSKTNGGLNLANLALVFRHAILARQLGLTVQDLLTAIELTGLDPFRSDRSQDSLRLIDTVRATSSSGFTFPQLDYLLRHRVNPAASFAPDDLTLAQTLTEVRTELLKIAAPSDAKRHELQRSAVIDRIAAALGLAADVTGDVLTRVTHRAKTALQRFLDLQRILDPVDPVLQTPPPLSRNNARPQFETLEKLLKIASVIQTLGLSGNQLHWLFYENPWLLTAPDPAATPVPFAQWFSLVELQDLRRALNLEDAAQEAVLAAISGVAGATGQPARLIAKTRFVDALSGWLGWRRQDVEVLIGASDDLGDLGLLNTRFPDHYRIGLVVRLNRAVNLLKRLGATATQASQWCEALVSDADAKAIRAAAKAKHDDDAWQKLAVPLQDALRDRQREALVSYLIARPALWTSAPGRADANDLYAHFLIDVEMSACQPTSRIKQAMGSVQLFAQRSLMGLEPDAQTDDPKWTQWQWMKNFRVWEANRKIWLYPENWIEPQLRDDKTPFFKELEDELLQSDLTNASAEQALRHYLEKLDEVSRLEMVGAYEDEDKTLHVFGRTLHVPHINYYRRRQSTTKVWTPWEKLELDIEGDHLIPAVWNRKLMLIWPIFTEKSYPKDVEMPEAGRKLTSADRYWDIQLVWSEYQNGRWSGKNLSDPVPFEAYQGEDNVLFGRRVAAPENTTAFLRPINDDEPPDPDGGSGPGGDGGDTPPPPVQETPVPRRLVSKDLFSFKAFASGDVLIVRGFLRRDYRRTPTVGDTQIACCFGEFRFSGCRKIVTTAHRGKISGLNFPLAPTGTTFDHMWFTGLGSGLTLFDGQFPVGRPPLGGTILEDVNERASIAGDQSPTVVNKLDIPTLGSTPWPFRLLAPHQDLQFVCDRPFFFMDNRRTFLVSSRGSSGKRSRPDLGGWVRGDLALAWRADYFPAPAPTVPEGPVLEPLTVLARGSRGERVATMLTAVNLTPTFKPRTLLPVFWTTREYTFTNFHHPYVCEFSKSLDARGISALLSLAAQRATEEQSFAAYNPNARALAPHPIDEVEFQSDRAYALYNWELFFHIPLLIADRLSKNQRFEEAQRWFHFIFDPTGASGTETPQRFWRTKPFHDRLASGYEAESVKTIEAIVAEGLSNEWGAAIAVWRNNPFSPHAIARLRTTAYQKTVVMKYIDNLIAWGDQLFRRETLESINEATLLYVLAAEILGRRPEVIERRVSPDVKTFNSLAQVGLLGNSLEQIDLLVSDPGDPGTSGQSEETPDPPSPRVLYFCVPENEKLVGYWNTVADRLFKIRHCMNIEGQVRQLPLFEPPIDPALLVRARAAGLSIAEVLSDIGVSLPNYRFTVMVQKASELVAEVRNLGAGLLSALEKRDAEALSTLRSGQEVRLLQAIRDIRSKQIDEAETSIASLEQSRAMAQARKDYCESREFISAGEGLALALAAASLSPLAAKVVSELIGAVSHLLPTAKAGSPTTAGTEYGGENKGSSSEAAGRKFETGATILNIGSLLATRKAEYDRRQDEWDHQANLATIELKQIDQQLTAAKVRLAIAEQELRSHDRQIENAREVDQLLRSKFTNQDLYQWMIGQVSGLYFQSYQLAYDLAKRSERCLQHELGLKDGETAYIRFGYWDSLRKGLLAGDHLAYDLKGLEVAYLDGNIREYELTKHVSLIALAPEQLLPLKESGVCEFEIPEWLFDLDTPGHYRRRLKMLSVTIPCVTGPYTTIHCKAQLVGNSFRHSTDLTPGYDRLPADDPGGPDRRFLDDRKILESIVTSTAQNDAGLFEPAMQDDRYLPFEGAGAVSRWRLELPTNFRTFDYGTISDVILHLRYTARDGGEPLKAAAMASVSDLLGNVTTRPLVRLFSLRHEFPSEWNRFVNSPASAMTTTMTANLALARFPYFAQGRAISIREARTVVRGTSTVPPVVAVAPGQSPPPLAQTTWTGQATPGLWTVGTNADPKAIEDVFIILAYTV